MRKYLIEAEELIELLKKPITEISRIRILDSTLFPPLDTRDINSIYKEKRIPYSQLFDLNKIADLTNPIPHTMPTNEIFIKHMKEMDIRKTDEIIIYDRMNTYSSPRCFLTFKWFGHKNIRVLNGGLPRYEELKGEIETDNIYKAIELNEYRKKNIPIKEDDYDYKLEQFRIYDYLKIFKNEEKAEIIDARSKERFEGKVKEPRSCLRVGHVSGASNLFYGKLLDDKGKYKSNDDIEKEVKNAGIDCTKPIIGYCGTGLTACIDLFGLVLIGKEDNIRLFDGSWAEYGNIPENEFKELMQKYHK